MSSEQGRVRASGQTQAAEVAEETAAELTEPLEPEMLDVERARTFEVMGFSRMRMDWEGDANEMMARIRSVVDTAILQHFPDAYEVMYDIYDTVRTPATNPVTSEVLVDRWGRTEDWERSPSGAYAEDWSRLTDRGREDFLFRITTSLFNWEQRAADMWGEAMFAKAVWTEAFARGYDRPEGRATIEARTATANVDSAEDRYFAILQSLLSRKADALVRSMTLIAQRLKDTMGS